MDEEYGFALRSRLRGNISASQVGRNSGPAQSFLARGEREESRMAEATDRKVYTAPTLESLNVRETRDGIDIGIGIGIGIGS